MKNFIHFFMNCTHSQAHKQLSSNLEVQQGAEVAVQFMRTPSNLCQTESHNCISGVSRSNSVRQE